MQKKDIDWSKLGFGYTPTDYRFEAHWKDGKWDEGKMITDSNIELSEAACVFHYAQCCFEGLKAYTSARTHVSLISSIRGTSRLKNRFKRRSKQKKRH
jgi:branched-chain amino acid aminotransferase